MALLATGGAVGQSAGAEEQGGANLPDGMEGFLGLLQGKLVEKGEHGFAVQVEKVVKTWEKNKAPNPESCVGRRIRFRVNPEQKHIIEQMALLETGDRVVAGGAHREGNALQAVEVLVRAAEYPALQSKWEAAARERKEREMSKPDTDDRIRQLERQVEELRKENEALRKKATAETRKD
jgi:hypothetical protein